MVRSRSSRTGWLSLLTIFSLLLPAAPAFAQEKDCVTLLKQLLSATAKADPETLLCKLAYIDGFQAQAEAAKKVLGATTTYHRRMEVHLVAGTHEGKPYLYAHSNLRDLAAGHPSKLLLVYPEGSELISPTEMLAQLISGGAPIASADIYNVLDTIRNHAVVFVDKSVLDTPRFAGLDFAGINHVHYLGRNVTEVGRGLFVRGGSAAAKALRARLLGRPVRDLQTICLVSDSKTVELATAMGAKLSRSAEEVKQALAESKGKTVVVLGHVEGEAFSDGGKEIVTFDVLQALARESGVDLIRLGCHTNAVGKLNSLDALRGLAGAAYAENYRDFFESLAEQGVRLLIDETTVDAHAVIVVRSTALSDVAAALLDQKTWVAMGAMALCAASSSDGPPASSQPPAQDQTDIDALPVLPRGEKSFNSVRAWVDEAAPVYRKAKDLGYLVSADQWNSLAWNAALTGRQQVAEFAVECISQDAIKESSYIADTIGVVLAIGGETRAAIEHFEAFVDDETNLEGLRKKRVEWIVALWKKENPFTEVVLRDLLAE